MHITISPLNDGAIDVSLQGEIDADNCAQIGEHLLTPGVESDSTVALDLSELSFIDSSGISELLRVRDAFDSAGGSLVIVNPSPAVRRVLEITGVLSTFGLS